MTVLDDLRGKRNELIRALMPRALAGDLQAVKECRKLLKDAIKDMKHKRTVSDFLNHNKGKTNAR